METLELADALAIVLVELFGLLLKGSFTANCVDADDLRALRG